MKAKKLILGCALGNCVHIAGLNHFLQLAELEGLQTISLGPAVPVERLVKEIINYNPEMVAISFRLTPEVAEKLLDSFEKYLRSKPELQNRKYIFGGTPAVAEVARKKSFFIKVFDGRESQEEIRAFLRGETVEKESELYPQTLEDRINQKFPYPIIRHHFGRPSLEETIEGARKIAESQVLDVISLGPDQNAQEFFFQPDKMRPELNGAGGVPVRRPEDLEALYQASRCGNFPLMRCYSGTNDLIKWAEMSVKTINNAWGAIPLTWYSEMDGRSSRTLEEAIAENQQTIKWYAERNIPVEVNESHQWSLRDAHDSLAVATALLAAYNAKKLGVKKYVSQYMFNTPPGTWPQMDLAKMMAKNELIEELRDETFDFYREVRAGIAHFSPDPNIAKGQLAASALISLYLKPHILHVVAYCEGDHAVYPDELIESCQIVHGVIRNSLHGLPEISKDKVLIRRKEELKKEARVILEAIRNLGRGSNGDPLTDPLIIAKAIKEGILDTPHFIGNPKLCGRIKTNLIDGAWYAVNNRTGKIIKEKNRLRKYLRKEY
ncbi:MAG: cobalamin B12-binding domain-containing protein [Acidobacteriota bacterium]|nr:cobalamin B12-binding domain-containing protein [Acidobacteriota bacterium]